ncbi:hypothetical protein H0A71_06100 [Alcaligenaceae bacterium]|nr:hypothetical protein [Alcaligenaceae bacterium]
MGDLMFLIGSFASVWLVVAWLACAAFCGTLAEEKRYCWPCWVVLGLLFGPLALVAAAGLPDRHVVRVASIPIPDEDSREYKALGFRKKPTYYEFGILLIVFAAIVAFALLR